MHAQVRACLSVCTQWYQSPCHDLMSYKLQSKTLEDITSRFGSCGSFSGYILTERALEEFILSPRKDSGSQLMIKSTGSADVSSNIPQERPEGFLPKQP